MRSLLKSLLVIFITAIIIILIYGGNHYFQSREQVDSTANNSTENSALANQNKTTDNNEKENISKEEPEEDVAQEENDSEEKEDEESGKEEVNINEEDKAIDLAKKQYGTTDGVYFRIEQIQSNGVYIVSVRNSETTRDIAWYTVNVKTGVVQ